MQTFIERDDYFQLFLADHSNGCQKQNQNIKSFPKSATEHTQA
jgi:hypothetical protein